MGLGSRAPTGVLSAPVVSHNLGFQVLIRKKSPVVSATWSGVPGRRCECSHPGDCISPNSRYTISPVLCATKSTFGPPCAPKKSEKGGPKKQKSGHGPEKADCSRTSQYIFTPGYPGAGVNVHTREIASRPIRDTQSRLFCVPQSPPLVHLVPPKSPKKVDRKNKSPDMVRFFRTVSGPFSEISPDLRVRAL